MKSLVYVYKMNLSKIYTPVSYRSIDCRVSEEERWLREFLWTENLPNIHIYKAGELVCTCKRAYEEQLYLTYRVHEPIR